jgi:hypothetical protein
MGLLCQHLVASSLSDDLALWKVTDPLTEETTFAGTVLALHCICTVLVSYCTVLYLGLCCVVLYLGMCCTVCLSLEPVSHITVVLRKTVIGQNKKANSEVAAGWGGGGGGTVSCFTRLESRSGHRLS